NIFFDISDTNFIIPGTDCIYAISPSLTTVSSSGSTNNIAITKSGSGSGCRWNAVSNAAWMTILSGSGKGSGTVTYSVLSNQSGGARTGTISVAGQTHTVTQNADGTCSFSLNPSSASFGVDGGMGSTAITTSANCNWTGISNVPWMTIASGSGGRSSGTVLYAVTPN